jgi:drug/metabolite transporter (DMT)-like permease
LLATDIQSNQTASTLTIITAFGALVLIKGANFLGIRFAVQTIPPFLMAGVRYTLAGGIMLAFLLVRRVALPTRAQLRSALVVGTLMTLVGNAVVSYMQQRVPSGLTALVVGSAPVWVTLAEWLIFRGKPPGLQVAGGLVIGFIGIVILLDPGGYGVNAGFGLISLLILLAATIVWATGWTYSRHADMPANPLMKSACVMLIGGLELMVLSAAAGEPAHLNLSAVSTTSILSLVYLIVFGSMVVYTSMLWLMQTVQPTLVATSNYVSPVIAILLGWLFAGEIVTKQSLIAAVVIITGVVLATSRGIRPVRTRRWLRESPPAC